MDWAGLFVFDGHASHVAEVWPVVALYWLAGQFVHAAAELPAALYLPAAHATTLAPDPVKPASAKHALRRVVLVDVVPVWLGHEVQAED